MLLHRLSDKFSQTLSSSFDKLADSAGVAMYYCNQYLEWWEFALLQFDLCGIK